MYNLFFFKKKTNSLNYNVQDWFRGISGWMVIQIVEWVGTDVFHFDNAFQFKAPPQNANVWPTLGTCDVDSDNPGNSLDFCFHLG